MAGFFSTLFGGGAEKEAAAQNRAELGQYYGQGMGFLNAGLPQQLQPLQQSQQSLTALGQKYGAGTNLYLDALGVNGPEGAARAQAAFTQSPGYKTSLETGIDAVNRGRALSSMLGTGNTNIDLLKYGIQEADKQYQPWLAGLQGLISPELQGVTGAAGVGGAISNVYGQNTANQIGLLTGRTQGDIAANNLVAQGEEQGGKNLLGLGQSLLGLGAGLAGAGSAGGWGSSFLGSMFGGKKT